MDFQVEGYIGALLEINLFVLISSKIKKMYQINFDNNISYYWLCFSFNWYVGSVLYIKL